MKRDLAIGAFVGTSVLATAVARGGSRTPLLAPDLLAAITLGTLATYDLHERRIPNGIVLPATAACALADAFLRINPAAFVTAGAITVALLTVALAHPTALGMGDAKLALLLTAAFPAQATRALLLGLGLAAIGGTLIARRCGKPIRHTSIPLAPFIGAATALALL